MRITIVQGAFLPVPALLGGAVEKVWFNLGKSFAQRGHDVLHVSRSFEKLPDQEVIEGVRHIRTSGFQSPKSFGRRVALDLIYALRVLPKLPRADIVVTNTFWLPALLRGKSRGVVYAHVARYPKGQMRLYRRAILQTVSEPIRDAILQEDPTATDRVRVIPYPLANAYLLPAVPAGENVILYTGRVHPEKGVHLLVEAFAQLPETIRAKWKVKIVGPWEIAFGGGGDAYLAQLKTAAAPLGGSIEFVGRVFDEAKLIAHYAEARVFVYPSLAEKGETFGLAALEAMAAGCAPIVSSLACFRDFIRPDHNGIIFDHRTSNPAAELANAITRLVSDHVMMESIRRHAWQDARSYTMDSVTDQFLEDFSRLAPFAQKTPAVLPAGGKR